MTVFSGGSDIHYLSDENKGGVAFDHKLESIEDFVKAMLNHEGTPVTLRDGKFTPVTEFADENIISRDPTLPVIMYDK